MMRTFKIYFLRNFKYAILLTITTMLCIISPRLTCLITESLCLLTTFTHFSHFPTPTSGNHQSLLCIYESSFLKIPLISEIIWHLSFSDLFHLIQCPQAGEVGRKSNCFKGMGSPSEVITMFWIYMVVAFVNTLSVLNATELFTLKWLILCYVNFISIQKERKSPWTFLVMQWIRIRLPMQGTQV